MSMTRWGQIKRLCQEGEQTVVRNPQPQNATTLFLARLAILSASASAQNYSYWVYIPSQPLNRAVVWGDGVISIYVSDSIWLPGPSDNRGPLVPREGGNKLPFYEVGVEGFPICVGTDKHCLHAEKKAWLSTVKNNSRDGYHKRLFLLVGSGFKGNRTMEAPPDIPLCTLPIATPFSDWVHWVHCQGEKGRGYLILPMEAS